MRIWLFSASRVQIPWLVNLGTLYVEDDPLGHACSVEGGLARLVWSP